MSKPLSLTLTLKQIVEGYKSLKELADQKASAALSYTLGIVLRACAPHMEEYETQRAKLIAQFTTATTEEDLRKWIDGGKEQFQIELDKLLSVPVTLNGVGKIKRSVLQAENIPLNGTQSACLDWLLKDDIQPMFADE